MSEPGSFSSIMALVENHLVKKNLQAEESEEQAGASFSRPNICGVQGSAAAASLLPPSIVMQLPHFEVKNNEITEILALQVRNMLMAKENYMNEEREKQRLVDEMQNMNLQRDDDDYVIGLTASIIRPGTAPRQTATEVMNRDHSDDSVVPEIPQGEINKQRIPESLPLCQNLSSVLFQKIRKGRCSEFGKVLSARYRPAAPYMTHRITHPRVIPFDFSTPSASDINEDNQMHPPPDPYAHMDMLERFHGFE